MIDEARHKGLGRGLSALLGEDDEDYATLDRMRVPREVPVEQLTPNPFQPRQRFNDEEIDALADSIREHGILQPILVRRHFEGSDRYEIIAGERRWRAAQRAQLHQVPVVIRDIDNTKLLEVALVENIQREDLTALEEAIAYQHLIDDFGHTQDALAKIVGKSRSHVANILRLLGLPDIVKAMLDDGAISAGHARALLTAKDPEGLAQTVVTRQLSVRETEQLAQAAAGTPSRSRKKPPEKDPDTLALEKNISLALGLMVEISAKADHTGEMKLKYGSLEQLEELCRRLCHR
ncbi:MAG: ParB/RepB/Spo0J family partition protein [Proteobacteria bacterium]|nr:ParB/RepB/Spo0J family partition protein [Pseudomonadota bacterium]